MPDDLPEGWIDAAAAAERLGVKPATLYAYVSRGVLTRRQSEGGRRSLFDAAEVEALARRGRPRRSPSPAGLSIESELTALGRDRPFYRGLDALDLAVSRSFESVADLLWLGPGAEPGPWTPSATGVAAARAAQSGLPADVLPIDRLQIVVAVLAATDPLRFHLDPPAVAATGRALISGMVAALPPARGEPARDASVRDASVRDASVRDASVRDASARDASVRDAAARDASVRDASVRDAAAWDAAAWDAAARDAAVRDAAVRDAAVRDESAGGELVRDALARDRVARGTPGRGIAEVLWGRLCAREPEEGLLGALEAALVLLADHELAASTLAARVAASVRADPYAVVSAGLGVLSGPVHGGASLGVERMLAETTDAGAAPRVIGEWLRRGERIPGLGHAVYKHGDARGGLLFDLVRRAVPDDDRIRAAGALLAEVEARRLPAMNVDFGLAVLTAVSGMVSGAGEAIFAVARTAGWLAHAMEEYAHRTPLRPRAVYSGPPIS